MKDLTINIDHRIRDGADAVQFTQALTGFLENPVRMLIEKASSEFSELAFSINYQGKENQEAMITQGLLIFEKQLRFTEWL
jgi:hypothetical protein